MRSPQEEAADLSKGTWYVSVPATAEDGEETFVSIRYASEESRARCDANASAYPQVRGSRCR